MMTLLPLPDQDGSDDSGSSRPDDADASDIAGVSENEASEEEEDDPETPVVDFEQGLETPEVDSDNDDEPIAGEPPPTRSRLGGRKPINYNDMSAAFHLKMAGFNSLMPGATVLNTAIRGYCHVVKASTEYNKPCDYGTIVNHCILSQYGLKKGLELFGTSCEDAVTKELKQLHDHRVLDPKHPSELTAEQRHKALSYLMFLKMKRDGDIKGRGYTDGRKQREYMLKDVHPLQPSLQKRWCYPV